MIIALNACLLKHASGSDWASKIINEAPPNDCSSVLWTAYSAALPREFIGKDHAPGHHNPTPLQRSITMFLEKPMSNTLLALLDADQKNFSIALKGVNPLGLFGLIHALSQYVGTKLVEMHELPVCELCVTKNPRLTNTGTDMSQLLGQA